MQGFGIFIAMNIGSNPGQIDEFQPPMVGGVPTTSHSVASLACFKHPRSISAMPNRFQFPSGNRGKDTVA